MNEKSGFPGSAPPPQMSMPDGSQQPMTAPPPYSPYQTGPTELDASKPYNPNPVPIGFQPGPPQMAPPQMQPPQHHMQQAMPIGGQPVMVSSTPATVLSTGGIGGHGGVTVVTPPTMVVTSAQPLGPGSVRMTCPFCKADMNTSTTQDPSMVAYISALVCCLVGLVWGCCLIPLCMDSCKKTEHHCANCKRFLGRYQQY